MSSSDVPEPWATRMRERGFTDPRYKHDVPSMSRLADRAGIHTSTVSAVISGRRKPGPDTVAALVDLLGSDVQDWLGIRVELGPYVPPAESALLTKPQREAMTALIRAIASEQRAGEGHDRPAATSQAGESPAPKKRRDPFAGKKPMMQDRMDPANRGGTWLQTLGIVDADGQLVRDRVNPDDVIADLIAPLVERGMSEADAIRWLRNRAVHDAGATGFGPGLPQREFADDPDPEDYLLAASDVDDDPEAEGWQEEP